MAGKRTKLKLIAAMLVCSVALCFVFSTPALRAEATTLSELQNKLNTLKEEEKQIAKDLQKAKDNVEDEKEYQTQLNSKINNVQGQISTLSQRISALDTQIEEKNAEIEETQQKIDENYELFKKRLRAMYMSNDATVLSVLFGSSTFAEFLSASETTQRIADHDDQLIKLLIEQKALIEEDKATIEESRKQIESDRTDLYQKENELNEAVSESEEKLNELEAIAEETGSTYAEIVERRKAADKEIENFMYQLELERQRRLREQAANGGGGVSELSPGGWLWPVGGYSRISDGFGWRVLNGRDQYHKGIDIPCAMGHPIRAAKDGVIVRANYSYSYGNVVVIDHGGGYCTLYAHNSSLAVSEGQTVAQGQTIAYAGTTGDSYGVHCHFEVWVNGMVQPPFNFVVATG